MYSFTSRVRYSECDERLHLTIPAFLNYLQDCSMFHCEHIGHGFAYCAEHHFAWFVIAWQIEVARLPAHTEEIRISTWCYEMTPTVAKRFFTIEDASGATIVRADSLVVAFDTNLGRVARIPDAERVFVSDEKPDFPPTKRKIKLNGTGEKLFEMPVTERLIDTNGHVNNVQYVAIAEDAIRMRDKDFELGRMYVQYRTAAHLGDTMHVWLYAEDGDYSVSIADKDGNSYAVVRMERRGPCARK